MYVSTDIYCCICVYTATYSLTRLAALRPAEENGNEVELLNHYFLGMEMTQ